MTITCQVSAAALFQIGDELLGAGRLGGGAGPGLLVVVQGGARVVQRVADPAVSGEEERDVVASQPGGVGVPPGFAVLDGLLGVAERLAGVPGAPVDEAELVFGGGS